MIDDLAFEPFPKFIDPFSYDNRTPRCAVRQVYMLQSLISRLSHEIFQNGLQLLFSKRHAQQLRAERIFTARDNLMIMKPRIVSIQSP